MTGQQGRHSGTGRRRAAVALVAVSALLVIVGIAGTGVGTAQATTPGGTAVGATGSHPALPVNPGTGLRPGLTPRVPEGVRSFSAPSGAHLTYEGGPVLSSMKSVSVLYGSGSYAPYVGSGSTTADFIGQFLGSGVLDWLHEYDTPAVGGTGQTIGRGSYAGTYSITPATAHAGSVVNDSAVVSELAAQIAAGHLPVPDANTSYALFFPHGEQICQGGSCSGVSGGFCAYHGTFDYAGVTATYQVMPDNQPGSGLETGCGSGTPAENETATVSHELVETITDPDVGFATVIGPPIGWYDTANGEIGDVCNAQHSTFTGSDGVSYTMQKFFSNAAADCIVSPLTAPSITSAAAIAFSVGVPGTFTVGTTGFPIPTVTETGTLPNGVTLVHGILAGTPTESGSFPITLVAHNASGADAQQSFTLTVGSHVPTVSIVNLPAQAYLGDVFTPSVTTGGDGATSVTSSTTSVCTVSGGVVSTISVGNCTLVAHVGAGVLWGAADGSPQTYAVLGFQVTTVTLPTATHGSSYGPVTLQAAGAGLSASPYATVLKWGKVTLPKGLKLSSTGVLSGVVSAKQAVGPSSITVKVTETVTTLNGKKKVKTVTSVQAVIPLIIL